MTVRQEPERAFVRVERNVTAGRDFVVGDVHGEFDTLEAMLASVGFLPGRDRLFALGDLIDRGPRSADALSWMESGRIELSVRGNHEQMLLDRIEATESDRGGRTPPTAHPLGIAHPWFARNVERSSWAKWKAMIRSMPFAATRRFLEGLCRNLRTRNLSTTLRHRRLRFTEQSLLLWMWQVG